MGFVILLFGLGAILSALPIIRFVGWWVEGSVSGLELTLLIGTYFGLLMLLFFSNSAWITMMALVLLIFGLFLMPYFGAMLNRKALRKIDEEEMYRARDVLVADPANHLARVVLAEKLHKLGRLDEAIEHLEYAVENSPVISRLERGKLQAWKREQAFEQKKLRLCPMCGAENPGEARRCIQCGSAVEALVALKEWAAEERVVHQVLWLWLIVMAVLTVLGFVFFILPLDVQGVLVISTLLVGGWLFLNRLSAWKETS